MAGYAVGFLIGVPVVEFRRILGGRKVSGEVLLYSIEELEEKSL